MSSYGSCSECGREWTGSAEAHCPTCCEHFASVDAFDAHLAPPDSDIACYSPESLTRSDDTPRFVRIDRAHGSAWVLNRPDLLARETSLSDLWASSDSMNGGRAGSREGAAV